MPAGLVSAASSVDARVLSSAEQFSDCSSTSELAAALLAVVSRCNDVAAAALLTWDEESGRAHGWSMAGAAGRGAWLAPGCRELDTATLERPSQPPADSVTHPTAWPGVTAHLRSFGATHIAAYEASLGRSQRGLLICGHLRPVEPASQQFAESLVRVARPALKSCLLEERFDRGDQRRDALLAVYNAINGSLELQEVLRAAREAIARLDGHRVSEIVLLQGSEHALVHRTTSNASGIQHHEPLSRALPDSVAAWVAQQRCTYESADLQRGARFREERELLSWGVRRCVAAPLLARERVLGVLLFGTEQAAPLRRLDVWLRQNIALQLGLSIDNAMQHERVQQLTQRLNLQQRYLQEEIGHEHDSIGMVGISPAMAAVRSAIQRVAPTNATVLITGETGVGKELVARALHARSGRAGQPMVKINCAAIPEAMVESELFGHERGAFTSAVQRRAGRFELARDSSLFLDEIGELSASAQAKLLRVLQDGEYERVGGDRTLQSNARIIAATNRDLGQCVRAGTFRQDLFYRVSVFPIHVPPLRERRADIPLLAEAFVRQFARRTGKPVAALEPGAVDALTRRDWPGNVRELRGVIERAVILCDREAITLSDLGDAPRAERAPRGQLHAPAPSFESLREAEARHIRDALSKAGGVIEGPRGAAKLLNMKPSTLRYRIRRLGLV